MSDFLVTGVILGLAAGFSPGPLLTLVISETLRAGIRSGVKVALAPIITDLPIIILTLLLSAQLSRFHHILGGISILGGCFVVFLGIQCLRTKGVQIDLKTVKTRSLAKGVIVNILSPHPYIFWFSVGAPVVTKAMGENVFAPAAFIAGFYVCLVGSKILLAFLVGRWRGFLAGRGYLYIMRFLGFALCVLAVYLFRDGLNLIGIL
ncbi:MAG TPA: LysE family transporter [Deltaproteobacteria bacterium]|nr:LysE family transporter [Deltaproteobacteria bacterium]